MRRILIFLIGIVVAMPSIFAWNAYTVNGDAIQFYPDSLWKDSNLPRLTNQQYKPATVGYLPSKLGYLPNEWYVWMNSNTDAVIFKAFTTKVICVLENSETVKDSLSEADMSRILKGFDYKKDFNISSAFEGPVRESFMVEALGESPVDGKIHDRVNGYIYEFKDGFLSLATPDDGLGKWAREFKGTRIFNVVKHNAEEKHVSSDDILKEINFQCTCAANMDKGEITVALQDANGNLALIWFIFHGVDGKGRLEDFLLCVPDAKVIEQGNGTAKLAWGQIIFEFTNDLLTKVY